MKWGFSGYNFDQSSTFSHSFKEEGDPRGKGWKAGKHSGMLSWMCGRTAFSPFTWKPFQTKIRRFLCRLKRKNSMVSDIWAEACSLR